MKNNGNIRIKPFATYILILAAAVIYIWARLWTDIAIYEKNSDHFICNTLVSEIKAEAEAGDCTEILRKCHYNEFVQSAEDAGKAFAELARGKEITLEQTKGTLNYKVLADGEAIAEFWLSENGKSNILGLKGYEMLTICGMKELSTYVKSGSVAASQYPTLGGLAPSSADTVLPVLNQLGLSVEEEDIYMPLYNRYDINGVFNIPSAYSSDSTAGSSGYASIYLDPSTLVIGDMPAEEDIASITEWIKDVTAKYSMYMTDDLKWDSFKGYVLSTSPVYTRISHPDNYRYSPNESTKCGDVSVSNPFMYSENLFSIRCRYEYKIGRKGQSKIFNEDYTYFLYKDEAGKYEICEIINNSEN